MNWYKQSQINSPLEDIQKKWRQQGVILYIFEKDNLIIIDSIIVPKDMRKKGIGTQIMQEVINYADSVGKRIELSPGQKDDYHGTTSRNRLVNFYKRFGLVENKGRNKDFTTNKTMYRNNSNFDLE
jgi:predicted GNAT family acetyltransferase